MYQYYPNTRYGNHGTNIKFVFDINNNGYITRASKREKGTRRILSRYQYYPGTRYGNHGTNIKFVFDINKNGYISQASKREKGTKRILSRYLYYPKTRYGSHGKSIEYIFDINKSGHVTQATRREKGTKKILTRYLYYPKTVFSKRGANISYIFHYNKKGYITSAYKRFQNSKKVASRYTYYPNAVYGKHGPRIKYIYNYDKSGYLTSSITRKDHSFIVQRAYEYYPKTTLKNRAKNIKYYFTFNKNGYITKAYLRKKNTQKNKGYYLFQSGTKYGNHWSRIRDMHLFLPKIKQNPGYPWGCAIIALNEALNFKGYNLSRETLINQLTYSKNPYHGYVGRPDRPQNGHPNLIYPEGLIKLAKKYRPNSEVVNGITDQQIQEELRKGNPVLVWVVYKFKPLKWKWYYNNTLLAPSEYHVIALSGYNNNQYHYVDTVGWEPERSVSKATLNKVFNSFDRRAIIVR